jgi:hypothetical protein
MSFVTVRVPKFSPSKAKHLATQRAVKEFLTTTLKDRVLTLSIAAGGRTHWMKIATEAFKGHLVDDILLGQMFAFICQQAGPDPGKQLDTLLQGNFVRAKMDRLMTLASQFTTERELDAFLDGKFLKDPLQKAAIRQELLRILKARTH